MKISPCFTHPQGILGIAAGTYFEQGGLRNKGGGGVGGVGHMTRVMRDTMI